MGVWHPTPEETFVFIHRGTGKRIVLLIPGGEAPDTLLVNRTTLGAGELFVPDEDATEKTRMFVSVDNRKRAEGLAD